MLQSQTNKVLIPSVLLLSATLGKSLIASKTQPICKMQGEEEYLMGFYRRILYNVYFNFLCNVYILIGSSGSDGYPYFYPYPYMVLLFVECNSQSHFFGLGGLFGQQYVGERETMPVPSLGLKRKPVFCLLF